jgi:2,5-diamino-6-(ribosylamino)-4(3H)-pyrimidinone 5'-phosphate reductase
MPDSVERKRPLVFINAAMSVDGKISSAERSLLRISDDEDMERVDRLRAEVDAIVVGGRTLLIDDPRLTIRSEGLRRLREEKGLGPDPIKVVVTGSGNVPLDSAFLREGEGPKLVFTTGSADRDRLEALSRVAEVHVIGEERVDFRRMMDVFARRGVGVVMVEGGATLNFEMIRAHIVDEIHVTISPCIIGGEAAPTLVDGKGFTGEGIKDLELISCERSGTSVLVKYRIKYDEPAPGEITGVAVPGGGGGEG